MSSLARVLGLVLALAAAGLAARPAAANEVDDRTATVTQLEERAGRLGAERRTLATSYEEKVGAVALLKAQPAAWGRDRKLQALLAGSQEMVAALDRKDEEVRAATARLLDEKRALLGALDAELAATPAPAPPRRAALEQARGGLAQKLARPIRIPDDHLDPADAPEDLELKAGALEQSETALRVEEERLAARATYFRRQARLAHGHARADEQDVFREEEARVPGRPSGASGEKNLGATDAVPPAATPGTGPVVTPSGGPRVDPRGLELATDPSLVLAGVVASSTLDELRRAERSGDPASLARSAERATLEVKERAERLRQRRLEMLERAHRLRGGATE